jgi:hypothetical protein
MSRFLGRLGAVLGDMRGDAPARETRWGGGGGGRYGRCLGPMLNALLIEVRYQTGGPRPESRSATVGRLVEAVVGTVVHGWPGCQRETLEIDDMEVRGARDGRWKMDGMQATQSLRGMM